jgi:hypothetical protein
MLPSLTPQEEIQFELDRRRPGQSRITTPRKESDTCELLSGMAPDGSTTLGTPICVLVRNKDQKSGDYSEMEQAYRPSHAGRGRWWSLQLQGCCGAGLRLGVPLVQMCSGCVSGAVLLLSWMDRGLLVLLPARAAGVGCWEGSGERNEHNGSGKRKSDSYTGTHSHTHSTHACMHACMHACYRKAPAAAFSS